MGSTRRNRIAIEDDRFALGLGVVAGIVATTAGASPTGNTVIDVVFVIAWSVLVTWASSSAPWWALVGSSALVFVASIGGPLLVTLLAVVAFGAAGWIASEGLSRPPVRAAIGALIVNVALRLDWDPFFLASAIVAAVATCGLVVLGVLRRRSYIRRRVMWGAIGVGGVAALFVGLAGIAALQAREPARDGYLAMLDGLEFVQSGDVAEATASLRSAAEDLSSASDDLGGVLGLPAKLVPGVAQNRDAGVTLLDRGASAATSAADALEFVDLDQLTVSDGVVNLAAFEVLEAPLATLDETITDLKIALDDAESPWLVPPVADRLDAASDRADQAAHQATATAAAARVAPELLGADGERRYLVAFVNGAEARGLSGLMGNWSEVTLDEGRFEVTANGRTADLQDESLGDLRLDGSDDYLARYGSYGARIDGGGVAVKYWSNVTVTPDMPGVGNAMSQMYEHVTGRSVDGVLVIDPAGIAALLEITGPVEVEIETENAETGEPEIVTRRVDSSNAAEFLTLEQYEFAENEREDLLTAITDATIENVFSDSLPAPQRMVPILAPAVLHGHIAAWVDDEEGQELFELVGMDASMPVIGTPGMDAIAVSNNNAGGNKIDSFLERRVTYRPVADEGSGETTATLTVEFTNTAPSTGYEEYVIGNLVDAPVGTNRTIVDVYTRLNVDEVRLDGEVIDTLLLPELGYWVTTLSIDVASGDSALLELDLTGDLGPGGYQLVYRPQPLPRGDVLDVLAETSGGTTVFEFDGEVERRTVFNSKGVSAWR